MPDCDTTWWFRGNCTGGVKACPKGCGFKFCEYHGPPVGPGVQVGGHVCSKANESLPAAKKAVAPAGEVPADIQAALSEFGLSDKAVAAGLWCKKEGAKSLDDIVKYRYDGGGDMVKEFLDALETLPKIARGKLKDMIDAKALGGGGDGGVSFNLDLPDGKIHHIFISYKADEMDGVFTSLMNILKILGFNVFNQKLDLAGVNTDLELMKKHAAGSVLVLALLSPNYFESMYCRGELEGAKAANVPINPVYSGEHHTAQQIKDLIKLKGDGEKGKAAKAAFGENLLDVNNGEHADAALSNLKEKILGRYFAK